MLYRPCSFIFPCLTRNPPHDAAVARNSLPKPRRFHHESITITTFGASQRRPTFAGGTPTANTPIVNTPVINNPTQTNTRTSNSTSGYSSFGSISDYPDDDDDEQDVYLGRGTPVQLTPLKNKDQSRDVITQIIIDLSYHHPSRRVSPVVKERQLSSHHNSRRGSPVVVKERQFT